MRPCREEAAAQRHGWDFHLLGPRQRAVPGDTPRGTWAQDLSCTADLGQVNGRRRPPPARLCRPTWNQTCPIPSPSPPLLQVLCICGKQQNTRAGTAWRSELNKQRRAASKPALVAGRTLERRLDCMAASCLLCLGLLGLFCQSSLSVRKTVNTFFFHFRQLLHY